ncbi:hypothetical protein BDV98DRAFT_341141 [Pterulicium gracile]|uniref:Uncharacterized protein n=1 Tax=Pterulicium gracile TaxID=1884261 RepID=A0A5C3Q2E1_9AGAR|nr:hypothetical protein BDV98DRAFT_341141 [Pterula gracilis]
MAETWSLIQVLTFTSTMRCGTPTRLHYSVIQVLKLLLKLQASGICSGNGQYLKITGHMDSPRKYLYVIGRLGW